jgi:hypothetical protein
MYNSEHFQKLNDSKAGARSLILPSSQLSGARCVLLLVKFLDFVYIQPAGSEKKSAVIVHKNTKEVIRVEPFVSSGNCYSTAKFLN